MNLFNRNDTKEKRRILRKNQTDAERFLWSKLRNKQMYGYKIFRQYGIGQYIVDFYCPVIKLVIELDGGQHFEDKHILHDTKRDEFMKSLGIKTIRINNSDALKSINSVLNVIEVELLGHKVNSPNPSLPKRGAKT